MTEHIYDIWKRRIPIIGQLPQKLHNCFDVIWTTAILHNLSIMCGDILPIEMNPTLPQQHDEPEDKAEEGAPQNEGRVDGEKVWDCFKSYAKFMLIKFLWGTKQKLW